MSWFLPHHTNYKPISDHHSLPVTHSNSFTLTANVRSCHLSRRCLLSTLLSILHIHLSQVHTFLGLVLRPLNSFWSVKLFFLRVFSQSYFSWALRKPRVQIIQSPTFKLVILFYFRSNSYTLTSITFSFPLPAHCYGWADWHLWCSSLIPFLFVAQMVNNYWQTQADQAKTLQRIEQRVAFFFFLYLKKTISNLLTLGKLECVFLLIINRHWNYCLHSSCSFVFWYYLIVLLGYHHWQQQHGDNARHNGSTRCDDNPWCDDNAQRRLWVLPKKKESAAVASKTCPKESFGLVWALCTCFLFFFRIFFIKLLQL